MFDQDTRSCQSPSSSVYDAGDQGLMGEDPYLVADIASHLRQRMMPVLNWQISSKFEFLCDFCAVFGGYLLLQFLFVAAGHRVMR